MQQNVLRLDVAVDHLVGVRVAQGGSYLASDGKGLIHRQLLLALELGAQRLTLDVGHDVEQAAAGLTGVVQREDVRMVEPRRDLDLAQEALRTDRRGQFGSQHFDRHEPMMLDVVREVDRRHAAVPQLALDRIATSERRPKAHIGSGRQALLRWSAQVGQISLNSFSIAAHDSRSAAAS